MSSPCSLAEPTQKTPIAGAMRIAVGSAYARKTGEFADGDVTLARKIAEEGRTLCILSDGLGSGVKANVLATLTASMALRFALAGRQAREVSEIIARTLPVCARRGIGYATMSVLDIADDGHFHLACFGNPDPLCVLGSGVRRPQGRVLSDQGPGRQLIEYHDRLAANERLLLVSDGITQAGMGAAHSPFGWGEEGLAQHAQATLAQHPDLGPRHLARNCLHVALELDQGLAKDDASCVVLHRRKERDLLLVSGPPFSEADDQGWAQQVANCAATKVVCGGSTAAILARELGLTLTMNPYRREDRVPPTSRLPGFALVSEGTITLAHCIRALEQDARHESATICRLVDMLLDHDHIRLLVGARVNPAHFDPRSSAEIEIRRDQLRRLAEILRQRWSKRVSISLL